MAARKRRSSRPDTVPGDKPGKRLSADGRAPGRRTRGSGTLVIIGGHEDKEGDKLILKSLCARAGSRRLVVATVASGEPDASFADYERLFRGMGCEHVRHLRIERREDALEERALRVLDDAAVVFFTGGDQVKITSQIGDTPVFSRIRDIFESGGTIAGTSAGASAMSETMMVSGEGDESHRIGDALKMAPGLGFISDVIIDQHFAQRGRIGRLLGAVAQNPRILGLGIDEDTAIIVRRGAIEVLGSGAVYVLDGRAVSYSNLSEDARDRALTLLGVRLHVLSQGDKLALRSRAPTPRSAEAIEARLLAKV
jgi:cyanophycinase